jgi:acetyl esterase/lipase
MVACARPDRLLTKEPIMARMLMLGFFASALASSGAFAQQSTPPPEIAPKVVQADNYPTSEVTFPNGVKGKPALVYWEPIGYRPLALDLYLPPETATAPKNGFPLVVYIHGGGWLAGGRHQSGPFVDFPGVLASLAARGYVVASIDYRLSGEAAFPAQIQDVKAAILWLRSHASEYGIDPMKAMTWGDSAGGHLAGLAGVSCGATHLEPVQNIKSAAPDTKLDTVGVANVSDCVQGSISWYGVFDMATIAGQARQENALSRDVADAPEWRLLGCFAAACGADKIAAASPITYVDPQDPPMLLIVGTEDRIVPYQQTLEMEEKLKSAGVPHNLLVLPGIDHSFIGKTPEQTREANLKALTATFDFIDKTMPQ